MRFLVDENCSAGMVEELRCCGFDVDFIVETAPGISDVEVLARAFESGRVLITEDTDFGELVIRHGVESRGVVLIRIAFRDRRRVWPRLRATIDEFGERLEGGYTVVQVDKSRYRQLPKASGGM